MSPYLLSVCGELHPVRTGFGAQSALDLDAVSLRLGSTPEDRAKNYRAWVRGAIPAGEWEQIQEAIQRGQLTGSDRFVEKVAKKIGRRVECRGLGRPQKKNTAVPFFTKKFGRW